VLRDLTVTGQAKLRKSQNKEFDHGDHTLKTNIIMETIF